MGHLKKCERALPKKMLYLVFNSKKECSQVSVESRKTVRI